METTQEDGPHAPVSRWQALVEYFIPDHIAADPNANNQAKMFLISHFFGPILGGSVPAALYLLDPTPGWEIAIIALGILSFWLFPFLLKAGVSYHRLVLLSIAVDWFVVYWACYFYGGVSSPTLLWFLIIPILALFYIGGDKRLHKPLLEMSALCSAIFFIVYLLFEPPVNDMPAAALSALGAMSTVAVLCYVAVMAIYYARIFDSGVLLEQEVLRRRQMAEELRQAIVKAHRVGSAKSEFLARMSHEIRTPLNAIIGYGQILREEAEDAEDRMIIEDVERILDAARYLMRLINMILDLAKIDAGRMGFDVRPHDLPGIIEEAIGHRREEIAASGVALEVSVDGGLGVVEVDRVRLLQIIDSILENAVHHTREGRILVTATQIDLGAGEGYAIAIDDTGTGMGADVIATIFETFATVQSAADGRYGGTGLNMAVCSQLCRAMGGNIAVSSAVGVGTTFTIRMPMRIDRQSRSVAEEVAPRNVAELRIA